MKNTKLGRKVDFISLNGMTVEQKNLFLSPEGNCGLGKKPDTNSYHVLEIHSSFYLKIQSWAN